MLRYSSVKQTNASAICALWDFNLNGNLRLVVMFASNYGIATEHSGEWSTKGVTTKLINSSYVQCVSSHLTCFTILSDAKSGTPSVRLQFLLC